MKGRRDIRKAINIWRALLVILLLGSALATGGDEVRYRVAGVWLADDGESTAVIESIPGAQASYHVGDRLGKATITAISVRGIELESSDGSLFLPVRDDGSTAPMTEYAPAAPMVEYEPAAQMVEYESDGEADAEHAVNLRMATIDQERLEKALDRLGPSEDVGDAAVSELLGLPAQARIVAINQQPVEPLVSVASALKPLLKSRELYKFEVSGSDEFREVYVRPRQ